MLNESLTEPSLALTIIFNASLEIEMSSFLEIFIRKLYKVFLSTRLKSNL